MERPRLAKHCISALTLTAPASQSSASCIQLNHATSGAANPSHRSGVDKSGCRNACASGISPVPKPIYCRKMAVSSFMAYRRSPKRKIAAIRAALIKSPVSHGIHAAFFFTLLPSLPYHYEADELYQKSHSGTRRMRADVCLFYRKGHKCNDSPEKPFFSTGRVDIRFCRML